MNAIADEAGILRHRLRAGDRLVPLPKPLPALLPAHMPAHMNDDWERPSRIPSNLRRNVILQNQIGITFIATALIIGPHHRGAAPIRITLLISKSEKNANANITAQ